MVGNDDYWWRKPYTQLALWDGLTREENEAFRARGLCGVCGRLPAGPVAASTGVPKHYCGQCAAHCSLRRIRTLRRRLRRRSLVAGSSWWDDWVD
jgi:hypothetical protein